MSIPDEPILGTEFDGSENGSDNNTHSKEPVSHRIRLLLENQLYGVLCTSGTRHAYGSLLAFAVTEDLKSILFSTPITTRKFKLLKEDRNIAFVIDSRSNSRESFMKIEAITATGKGILLPYDNYPQKYINILIKKHPYLEQMLTSESFAFFKMEVMRYFYVTRFQEVIEWRPN